MSSKLVFSGIGDDWWRQIFDGKYHKYGSKVFDEALHGGVKEPGFYQSAHNAFNFTKEHCGEPLTLDFYCKLHQIACAHFKEAGTNTKMSSKDAGKFIGTGVYAKFKAIDIMKLLNDSPDAKTYIFIKTCKQTNCSISEVINTFKSIIPTSFNVDVYTKLDAIYEENLKRLKEEIKNCRHDFLNDCMPQVTDRNNYIVLDYTFNPNREEKITKLFNVFIKEISDLQDMSDSSAIKKQKLKLVAELYQMLEWVHPFPDGQGRTDLFVLSKTASEVGLTPSILEDPYASSVLPLATWIKYLENGMQKWSAFQKENYANLKA